MNQKTLYRLILTSLTLILVLAACNTPQAPSVIAPSPFLTDGDVANATVVPHGDILTLEGLEGATIPDGELVELAEATLSTAAVLPNMSGYVSFTQFTTGASNPWSIAKAEQATDIVTQLYSGSRAIDSVATTVDGSKTVFSMMDAGNNYQVYLYDSGSPVQQLTTVPGDNTNVSISADGSVIVWEGKSPSSAMRGVFIYRRVDNNNYRLTFLGSPNEQVEPTVSGNGSFIAMVRRFANQSRIMVYDVSANSYTIVAIAVTSNGVLSHPSVSNDGNLAAWLNVRADGLNRIVMKNLTSTLTTVVMASNREIRHPHLTSDGGHLTYGTSVGVNPVVMTRSLSTNEVAQTVSSSAGVSYNAMFWQIGDISASISGTVMRTSGPVALPQAQAFSGAKEPVVTEANPLSGSDLLALLEQQGSLRVIVSLNLPFVAEGYLSRSAVDTQRASIERAQSAVLSRLGASGVAPNRFSTIPALAVTVDKVGLLALLSDPYVAHVSENYRITQFLAESIELVGADVAHNSLGFTGAGTMIAVIDGPTQVDHPFLESRVTWEACTINCPNGTQFQEGPGASVPLGITDSHGTHVSGIAAGRDASMTGVAPDAEIMAVKALHDGGGSWESVIGAMEYVYTKRADFSMPIAAVNMSLGGGNWNSAASCDAANPTMLAAADNLMSAGIAVVAASGNGSQTANISAPACISSVISVGNTGDGSNGAPFDTVWTTSNSANFLDLLAPGRWINSSVVGGGFDNYSGTSMASPHIAGAFAVLREAHPSESIAEHLARIANSGLPITDARNNITKPRLRLNFAVEGRFAPAAPTVDSVSCAMGSATLFGSALPNATVTLYSGTSVVDSTSADSAGVFSFSNVASGQYSITQTDDLESAPTPVMVDCALITVVLRDSSGGVVATVNADDEGHYEFATVAGGNYYLSAFADSNSNGRADVGELSGAFGGAATPALVVVSSSAQTRNFEIGVPTEVEPNNNLTTNNLMFIGTAMHGTISADGDFDHFRLLVPSAGSYTMETFGGECRPSAGRADTILTLYSSTGTQLAENDDISGSLCSRIVYTFTSPGTYFVRVRAFGTGSGPWALGIW